MKCLNDTGKCMHRPKCAHACNLRVQPVMDALSARDDAARIELQRIGRSVGYGNSQHILGQLWDEMLGESWAGRGSMGVSANEQAAYKRGWDDCVAEWAKHMQRVAKAVQKGPK